LKRLVDIRATCMSYTRANAYVRKLLIHDARSLLKHLHRQNQKLGFWMTRIAQRAHKNVARWQWETSSQLLRWRVCINESIVSATNSARYRCRRDTCRRSEHRSSISIAPGLWLSRCKVRLIDHAFPRGPRPARHRREGTFRSDERLVGLRLLLAVYFAYSDESRSPLSSDVTSPACAFDQGRNRSVRRAVGRLEVFFRNTSVVCTSRRTLRQSGLLLPHLAREMPALDMVEPRAISEP